jgi:hypothetical protein
VAAKSCGLIATIAGLQVQRLVIPSLVTSADDSLPDDVETLQRLLRSRDAELARARAHVSSAETLIAHLFYGQRSERKARLLDQMELELEELKAAAAEDERRLTPLVQKQIDALAAREKLSPEEAKVKLLGKKQPSLEFTTPEQLGALTTFLCADAAAQLNGVALPVDGGWHAR